jgi:hypothetical protein
MNKALVMVLGLGIMCSPSFSQEAPSNFCFIDQIKKMKPSPNIGALWGSLVPNYFKDTSSRPDVQTQDNLVTFLNASGNSFRLDFRATEERDLERDRIRKHRLISGLGLAGSWVATFVGDLLYEDGYRMYTLIPVIGPFITIAIIESHHESFWSGASELLILSGVAQSVFATYFIISLLKHPKPSETKSVTVWPSVNSINLRIQF